MTKTLWLAVVVCVVTVGAFWYRQQKSESVEVAAPVLHNYKNISYMVDGSSVSLINGRAESEVAPGSQSKIVTQFFGNEATGDLTHDGIPDVAFILTQSGGGSGIFYYVVVAVKTEDGYKGTNAILLGDRIAPQSTNIHDGQVIAHYADRSAKDPMTTQPSVGVSKYMILNGMTLTEVLKTAGAGERCGGNMTTALKCSAGLHCAAVAGSHLPVGDVGGVCVKD